MTRLHEASIEQLQQELKKRESHKDKPEPLEQGMIDFSAIIESTEIYMKEVAEGECSDHSDAENNIVETVLGAVYGKDVYDWINRRLRDA